MRLALTSLASLLFVTAPAFAGDDAATKPGAGKHGEHAKELLAKFDTNHDGKLDDSEKAAARAAYAERIKKDHPGLFKRLDTDGDGTLSEAEAKAARAKLQELKKKADTDGDGELSDAEKAAAKAKIKERLAERKAHGDAKPQQ